MFIKTIKKQKEYIKELEKNIKITKNNSKDMQKILLDDFILTINEIQDIQAINISEKEKDHMRNSIINKKRTEYVTKLIELSNDTQKIDNSIKT